MFHQGRLIFIRMLRIGKFPVGGQMIMMIRLRIQVLQYIKHYVLGHCLQSHLFLLSTNENNFKKYADIKLIGLYLQCSKLARCLVLVN